jgi:hypothetical protein
MMDSSAFEDISLCVVDTTLFPPGVFLRDLDLIRAFRAFDEQLDDFGNLRLIKRGELLYFGEYISQGALKIEDSGPAPEKRWALLVTVHATFACLLAVDMQLFGTNVRRCGVCLRLPNKCRFQAFGGSSINKTGRCFSVIDTLFLEVNSARQAYACAHQRGAYRERQSRMWDCAI